MDFDVICTSQQNAEGELVFPRGCKTTIILLAIVRGREKWSHTLIQERVLLIASIINNHQDSVSQLRFQWSYHETSYNVVCGNVEALLTYL